MVLLPSLKVACAVVIPRFLFVSIAFYLFWFGFPWAMQMINGLVVDHTSISFTKMHTTFFIWTSSSILFSWAIDIQVCVQYKFYASPFPKTPGTWILFTATHVVPFLGSNQGTSSTSNRINCHQNTNKRIRFQKAIISLRSVFFTSIYN